MLLFILGAIFGLFLDRFFGSAGHRRAQLTIRITDPDVAIYIEGVNLKMNLKNTQRVDLEVVPKNRLGGPATLDFSAEGSGWTGWSETNAFSVGPNPDDPDNKLKCRVTADPSAGGDVDDVGVAHFEADGDLGEGVRTLMAEVAINVIPADAEMLEVTEGSPTEQA